LPVYALTELAGKKPAMRADEQLAAHARELIDSNRYMTLGTADADGNPWVTPVFYATADYASFYWVSQTDAVHSRNLASRPRLSIVIFDSTVPAGTGRAVYMTATARELTGSDLDLGVEIYPGPAVRGGSAVTREEVRPPEPDRLYRAVVSACSVLCPREPGQPCLLHGIAADHRAGIALTHLAGHDAHARHAATATPDAGRGTRLKAVNTRGRPRWGPGRPHHQAFTLRSERAVPGRRPHGLIRPGGNQPGGH
jgi:hypothetical protein